MSPSDRFQLEPIPFELRIGITGHRRLENPDGVQRSLDELFVKLKRLHKNNVLTSAPDSGLGYRIIETIDRILSRITKLVAPSLPLSLYPIANCPPTPFRVLAVSSLASGADQLATEFMLTEQGARLQTILPFPHDEYVKDFESTTDLESFERLFARSSSSSVAHKRSPAPTREELYLRAGHDVVDQSDILLAIWDGNRAGGVGGTGDVIAYACAQHKPVLWINTEKSDLPITLVSVDESNQDENGTTWQVSAFPTNMDALSTTYGEIDAYNDDPAYSEDICQSLAEKSYAFLNNETDKAGLPSQILERVSTGIFLHQIKADQLAIEYQRLHIRSAVSIFILSALAVSTAVLQNLFFPKWIIALEVLAMLSAVVILRITKREEWHEKWLHYRHLAEKLRSQLFIGFLRGLRAAPDVDPSLSLAFYSTGSNWADRAIEQLPQEIAPEVTSDESVTSIRDFINSAWIQNQASWHLENAKRKGKFPELSRRASLVFFSATIVAATLHMIPFGLPEGLAKCLIAVSILLPVWGATIHAISNILDQERMSKQSQRMGEALTQISDHLSQATTAGEVKELAGRACQLMATENHDWMISLSLRGPVLPG